MGILIRPELEGDIPFIRRLNADAFGRNLEGALVDRLRARGALVVSRVAEVDGIVAGHIALTRVTSDGAALSGTGLGPMAVLPELQRAGIGSRLVRAGLEACAAAGFGYVVVLGHPDFYPRFGFVPASLFGLDCKWPVPDAAFMVRELLTGTLDAVHGRIEYQPEFDEV
ncbi:MAG TPA: N-acetyltransferase [Candidatus Deferrimicrobiaceae bacterium]